MPEVYGALIGAAATAFLMVLSNVSNRRERDIRELFKSLMNCQIFISDQSFPFSNGLWLNSKVEH